MEKIIIVSNPGSASKKYAIYQFDEQIAWFHFEKINTDFVCSQKVRNSFQKEGITLDQYTQSLSWIMNILLRHKVIASTDDIKTIAVRSVIPDSNFLEDKVLTKQDISEIKKLKKIDPLHITGLLDELDSIQSSVSNNVNICIISDSSFHLSMKRKVPLPFDDDVYSIGYHGLSCESVLDVLKQNNVGHTRLCVCHLGSGSSITSIRNSKSVYNSMEYSPLGGIIMSSRSGSVDPFLILKIMKEKKLTYEKALILLYTESGLFSLSGVSSDLRKLREESFKGNDKAKDALIQFVDSIIAHICKAISYAEGVDTIVFTGTIGCRAPYIREMVTEKLIWLGVTLNHDRNLDDAGEFFQISTYDSKIKVYVVEINEMKQMYTHVQKISSL